MNNYIKPQKKLLSQPSTWILKGTWAIERQQVIKYQIEERKKKKERKKSNRNLQLGKAISYSWECLILVSAWFESSHVKTNKTTMGQQKDLTEDLNVLFPPNPSNPGSTSPGRVEKVNLGNTFQPRRNWTVHFIPYFRNLEFSYFQC